MSRYSIIGTVLIIAFSLFVVFLTQVRKMEKYPMGSKMPKISFEGIMGKDSIVSDSSRLTIIFWFHPDCEHCRYQLTILNTNMQNLLHTRFFLLTDERKCFNKVYLKSWPSLHTSQNVFLGVIDKDRFADEFGPVVNPSMFVFDQSGVLREKLYGEVKFEKIQQIIKTNYVPGHIKGGHK